MIPDLHVREKTPGGTTAFLDLLPPGVEITTGTCHTCSPRVAKSPVNVMKLVLHQHDCQDQIARELKGA